MRRCFIKDLLLGAMTKKHGEMGEVVPTTVGDKSIREVNGERKGREESLRREFFLAIAAGVCIALGGTAYLSVENQIIGALFFTVGLFAIVTNGFSLFTGRACFLLENPPAYLVKMGVIWLGNFVGAALIGYTVGATRIAGVAERAAALVETKLADTPWSIFLLAMGCNLLLYVAVTGFEKNEHELGKYIGLFLGVGGFILCGFEHCIANMFYFSAANAWNLHAFCYLLIMTAGNMAGAIVIPLLRRAAGDSACSKELTADKK